MAQHFRSGSGSRICRKNIPPFAFDLFPIVDVARPVVFQEAREGAVGEYFAFRLAAWTVIRLVLGVDDALHRRAAHGARLAEAAMDRHVGTKGGHLLGEV